MTSKSTGRNDPCPCGSGKKYKHCCLGKNGNGQPHSENENPFDKFGEASARGDFDFESEPRYRDPFADLKEAVKNRAFGSEMELNAFAQKYMEEQNRKPMAVFQGLSPTHVNALLYNPFESPEVVTVPDILPYAPIAPVLTLFELIMNAIGEKGLKSTEKGNLPRAFCREAALAYWGEERYAYETRISNINMEADFIDLQKTRFIMKDARLIRRQKGRWLLTKKCRQLWEKTGAAAIYPLLWRSYARNVEWGYWDHMESLYIIQDSFLFSLYLLQKHVGVQHPQEYFEDLFLDAFPGALNELPPTGWWRPEEALTRCYTVRFMIRFAEFFGLVELEARSQDIYPHCNITPLPLVRDIVKFHV